MPTGKACGADWQLLLLLAFSGAAALATTGAESAVYVAPPPDW